MEKCTFPLVATSQGPSSLDCCPGKNNGQGRSCSLRVLRKRTWVGEKQVQRCFQTGNAFTPQPPPVPRPGSPYSASRLFPLVSPGCRGCAHVSVLWLVSSNCESEGTEGQITPVSLDSQVGCFYTLRQVSYLVCTDEVGMLPRESQE